MDPQTQTPPVFPQQPSSQPQQQTPVAPAPLVQPPPAEPVPAPDAVDQPLTPAPQYNETSQSNPDAQPEQPVDYEVITQQIASAISDGKNVLVTVSVDPSVDELASAVAMTFLLSKLGKHATAVFSGKIPHALEFLDPEAIFEDTVDSLRDFIIALDKEKADKLRYKVEEDVVKIFITPYKTILSEKDFEYSQGDYNVDVVLALGVTKREELDKAITSHGRILHDATVITINAGGQPSGLGSIDWHDPEASSVAEMLVLLGDSLGKDKFDSQISTAFLTGLVAQTNRFSNDKTSPKVMTTAAQLMAAGANQQLVATNLRQEGMISEPVRNKEDDQPHDDDGEMVLDHSEGDKNTPPQKPPVDNKSPKSDTTEAKTDSSNNTPSDKNKSAKKDSQPEQKNNNVNTDKKKAGTLPVEPTKTANSSLANEDSNKSTGPIDSATSLRETLKVAEKPSKTEIDTPQKSQIPKKPVVSPQNSTKKQGSDSSAAPLPPPPLPEKPADTERPHKIIEPLPSSSPVDSPSSPAITQSPYKAETQKPSFGGTLNATTAQAEADKAAQEQREAGINNAALSHDAPEKSEEDLLKEARSAVESAASSAPFDPANQPVESLNAQPLEQVSPPPLPSTPPAAPLSQPKEPSPVDEFMQPHQDQSAINVPPAFGAEPQLTPASPLTNPPVTPAPQPSQPVMPPATPSFGADQATTGLPPLPPLPGGQAAGAMPPMPPLPGNSDDPVANTQPQVAPEFMSSVSQSQNAWTDAGEDMSKKYAERDAKNQQRQEEIKTQYDQAVERNQQLKKMNPPEQDNQQQKPQQP